MLVGSKELNTLELSEALGSVEALEKYTLKCIPRLFLKNKEIIDNQKYLIALYVRRNKKIPFERREALLNEYLKGVHINGVADKINDIEDLLQECDLDLILSVLEETLS